jgi:hypothetical protein
MLSTVTTIALKAAGTGASALWFLAVLRKLGLRLRFARPEPSRRPGAGGPCRPAAAPAPEVHAARLAVLDCARAA